jgi:hypothetical protein
MTKDDKNEEREYRISMEVVVDAYDSEEQALGWYYYLHEKITFPFKARCFRTREISPLHTDEKVQVVGMTSEDSCLAEMFVYIEWSGRKFGVPLSQLEGIKVDKATEEAISDWHYWVDRGYLL